MPGNGYFDRPFCLKELRWAIASGKYVQPVIDSVDKTKIGQLMEAAPRFLQGLSSVDWVHLDRTDPRYFRVGVDILLERASAGRPLEVHEAVAGLAELLERVKLFDLLAKAEAWCEEHGATELSDITEYEDVLAGFVAALNPKPILKRRLVEALKERTPSGKAAAAEPPTASISMPPAEQQNANSTTANNVSETRRGMIPAYQ